MKRTRAITTRIMKAVRSTGTTLERMLAKALRAKRLSFSTNSQKVKGKPDFVFRKHKLVVFVDGDLWHGRQHVLRGYANLREQFQKTNNRDYWVGKIQSNYIRDRANDNFLEEQGWRVIRFWEKEVVDDLEGCVGKIASILKLTTRNRKLYQLAEGRSRYGAGGPRARVFIDLFCGIGGFHVAFKQVADQYNLKINCALASDIDHEAQRTYAANFGGIIEGDITKINEKSVPDHDLLFAGFPCQPFSIIGNRKGFEDIRGTLFFDIARILREKQPSAFLLENVKQLIGHDQGHTLRRIIQTLEELGYFVDFSPLNALDYGLPQKRERVLIVGFKKPVTFCWPAAKMPMTPLAEILETNVPPEYLASDYIREKRRAVQKPTGEPTIWHENRAGHISAYPFSCALRAGASYNYLLVNGERRLTPREMLRLQGFPDSFRIISSPTATRKQAGNSVPVPIIRYTIEQMVIALGWVPYRKVKYATRPWRHANQSLFEVKYGT